MKSPNKSLPTFSQLALIGFLSLHSTLSLAKSADTIPNIVVTIKPIHSLVASIMEGVGKPALLMRNKQSLHHYNLRPSDRRLISAATLIFWVGPELEVFLPRLLATSQAKNVALINSNQLTKLNRLTNHHHGEDVQQTDPHIWLSTKNAAIIVDEITNQLITIDPAHRKQFEKNQYRLKIKIAKLHNQLNKRFSHKEKPYITFHNAIQYFEKEFKLNDIATIQANDETQPSAKHIRNILKKIKRNNVSCLIYNEPEKPRLITSLEEQTQSTSYAIDPTGVNIKAGKNAWFNIMKNLTSNLSTCLKN